MKKTEKNFIYQDSLGDITLRTVLSFSETDEYIQGECSTAKAFRTFRKDRILEEIEDLNVSKERLNYYIKNNPPPKKRSQGLPRGSRSPSHAPDVCFTGFKKENRANLVKLAKDSELAVRSSVTHDLDFLCYGYNAGPKKLEKARHQGVLILSEEQFKHMLETGEIPEEA